MFSYDIELQREDVSSTTMHNCPVCVFSICPKPLHPCNFLYKKTKLHTHQTYQEN